jgi:hypothetical protein
MINQMNSSGAQPVQPSGAQLGAGLQPYAASFGANPYGQVLGGAMGSLSQVLANPQLMKMLASRLQGASGAGVDPSGGIPTISPVDTQYTMVE